MQTSLNGDTITMTNHEETAGGLLGRLAGRAKAAAGKLMGDDRLAREGRLQEAHSEAGIDARRATAAARVAAEQAYVQAEHARLDEARKRLRAEVAAEDAEQRADGERFVRDADAARLEQAAERADARADAIDPKEDDR
ncbi:MAG: hypothetical protein QOG68_2118 [Solirubrobacteraceae bacterium]|nr:hypothetical protein [Solirubrobacteraceae bacterium]